MKISVWGRSFTESVDPSRQLNLDVLARFLGWDGIWLPPSPRLISLASAFLDEALFGEWNDGTRAGRLQELLLSKGIAQHGSRANTGMRIYFPGAGARSGEPCQPQGWGFSQLRCGRSPAFMWEKERYCSLTSGVYYVGWISVLQDVALLLWK